MSASRLIFFRIDFRILPVIFGLMTVSLLVLSSYTRGNPWEGLDEEFFTPIVWNQIHRFLIGWGVFFYCAAIDYNKLREWTWILYLLMLLSLMGLFFTDSIQRVHRWYRLPLIGISFQPSEYAKLVMVFSLAWFLERVKRVADTPLATFGAGLIVFIPFVLIYKQPDLGTSLALIPISLVMFYFGGVHPWVIRFLSIASLVGLLLILSIFLGLVSHEEARPIATKFLKSYQYDRLDPQTHHQKAAIMAIAVGGIFGKGWKNGEFTGGGWLPMPATDSVFPAFGEEFGFIGLIFVMTLFYLLVYFGFQVTAVAKDDFGRLLSAGITVYLAVHILVNIGMMCGLLPITGVPLILVTYGGSSIFTAMAALGILQSIYSRRFMF